MHGKLRRISGPVRPQLVWVDTDIGDDIDDAFALALILRSPELRVLGISTAFGRHRDAGAPGGPLSRRSQRVGHPGDRRSPYRNG